MYNRDDRARERYPRRVTPSPQALSLNARLERRVATLERRALGIVQQAHDAGVDITYLGVAALFEEPRAYAGPTTDWLIAPVTDPSKEVVPWRERQSLRRLTDAGLHFPCTYIAHELEKHVLELPAAQEGPVTLDRTEAASVAAATVPEPMATTDLSHRLGRSSARLLRAIGKALPIAGAIAAAPFIAAGAALGALTQLDPVVIGAIPTSQASVGQPAAWYVLARWEW